MMEKYFGGYCKDAEHHDYGVGIGKKRRKAKKAKRRMQKQSKKRGRK